MRVCACLLLILYAAPLRAGTIRWDRSSLVLVAAPASYGRMVRVGEGAMLCSFTRGRGVWVTRSADEGRTWSEPVEAVTSKVGNATNGELLRLADGTVLLATNERPRDGKSPFAIQVQRSADGGRTWSKPHVVYRAGTAWGDGCWEPAAVQLPSGEVQLFFANESPYRTSKEQEITLLHSADGGKAWGKPETVSLRRGHRDGMPVPLVLRGGRGIVAAIEDNGMRGRMKPVIVHTSTESNWRDGVVGGDSPRRWSALKRPLPPEVTAGAPYIRQFPSGETVLSCQSDEGGGPLRMAVYVGDADARNFAGKTVPFPVDAGKSGMWNALFIKGPRTVTAISGTTIGGVSGLWAIDGELVRSKP